MAPARSEATGKQKEAIERACRAESSEKPLYKHGIPLKAAKGKRKGERGIGTMLERRRLPPGAHIQGEPSFSEWAATDGCMIDPAPIAARRAGWSAVALNQNGDVRHALYGALQVLRPTAFKAELYAMVRLVQNAKPPLKVFCDRESLVNTFGRGAPYCKNRRRQAADLWRELRQAIRKWSPEERKSFEIAWTKGHAKQEDIEKGVSTNWQKKANDNADFYARMGSEWAKSEAPNEAAKQEYQEARDWYKWLEKLIEVWPNNDAEHEKAKQKREERGKDKKEQREKDDR